MSGVNVLVLAIIVVAFVLPAVITALKGKWGLFVAGIFFHLCWWIGAIRLAMPDSYWARHNYNADKLNRSRARFAVGVRR
jgi:hypothetical protein